MDDKGKQIPHYRQAEFVHPRYGPATMRDVKACNSRCGINQLPPEIMSHIFITSEIIDRSTRPRKQWYIGVQDLVTQICSYWRDVAINTRNLWTYIHITRRSLHHLARLYLYRAGPSALLDIDLEMRSRFYSKLGIEYDDWEDQVDRLVPILRFLIAFGADVGRWRSLTICAKQPQVLYRIIGFLNARPAPALQFLSCRWKEFDTNPHDDEIMSLDYPHLFTPSYSFHGSSMPNLRHVELTSVPWGYVFDRALPLFTGLTSLSLTAGQHPICPPSKLRDLLAANPLLESLTICTGSGDEDIDDEEDIFESLTEPIQLLCLNSLSVCTSMHVYWALNVLRMIQAPALRKLILVSFDQTDDEDMALLWPSLPVATNQSDKHARNNRPQFPDQTPYPMLDELDVSKLNCQRRQLIDMFLSLHSVTKLAISDDQTILLGEEPWVLPKLTHLKLPQAPLFIPPLAIADILHRREQAGFPIKLVEMKNSEDMLHGELPGSVKIVRYSGVNYEEDEDDSDLED